MKKGTVVEAEQGVSPVPPKTPRTQAETTAAILRKLVEIEQRLERLESVAHSEHTLGPDVVGYLTRVSIKEVCRLLMQETPPADTGEQAS